MAYPASSEFQQAIQNPQLCLNDEVLKTLKARVMPATGLPHALSGGFSLTFIMEGRGLQYAYKCYTKKIKGLGKRYEAISEFLDEHPMQDFLAYEYQAESIYINDKWWPALKMDYLQADGLSLYIEDHLDDPDALEELRKKFAKLIHRLEKAGMAHGDLQHGNILVDPGGDLHLIDYDGMYTPNMSFTHSNEIGHVNFQHPDRSEKDFHAKLDRFSAIVIDLSLEALSRSPAMWDNYYDGDNLILKQGDLENPDSSAVLREIERLEGLEKKVKDFRLLCKLDMEALPALKDWHSGSYELTEWISLETVASRPEQKKKKGPRTQFPVLGALEKHRLLEYEGQVVTVYGRVTDIKHGMTKYNKPYVFINFADWRQGHFKLTIWSEGLEYLEGRGIDVDDYEDSMISFTGLIEEYRGTPGITFSPEKADKINVISGDERSRLDKEARLWKEEEDDNTEYTIKASSSKSTNAEYWSVSSSQSNRAILKEIEESAKKPQKSTAKKASNGNCWIAGAVFNDPLHPRVMELRRWRDEVLRPRWWGRVLIRLYYCTGPMVSHWLKKTNGIKRLLRQWLENL